MAAVILQARRLVLGFGVLMLFALACQATRLAWIQLVDHRVAESRQERMSLRRESLPARRGSLLDRHGRLLASSVKTLRAEVLPRNVMARRDTSGGRARLARDIALFLSPLVSHPAEDLARRLTSPRWSTLGKPVQDPDAIEAMEQESRRLLYGVDLSPGWARRAPWGRCAGNLLGYVDHSGHGVAGLELGLDHWLYGADGWRDVRQDHRGRRLADDSIEYEAPLTGLDVTLTLDAVVQQMVEQECLLAHEANEATAVMAVVLDVDSGDILAMVSVPDLDADDPGDRPVAGSVITPVQTIYAPGSTLKPLMLATALELEFVRPDQTIDTSPEQGNFGARKIRDTHPFEGHQTLGEIIVNSSNIGMANVLAARVPEDKGRDTSLMEPVFTKLHELGFGRHTGIPVPFEAAGIITPLERWTRNYTLVSISFGQEIAVTALQMAAGISTLADGLYRPPRLIKACSSDDGRSEQFELERPRPVFTRDLADRVRGWMAESVRFGSCAALKLPGMSVAGKTGTATSETDPTQETHSFAALAPALDPVIALVVVVQEPSGVDFASQSAAPAAGRILSRLMPYLGYPIE